MSTTTEEPPLQSVQLEALTVMKLIKHCATRHPQTATGFLVGMDNGGILEVTNCFPFPVVDIPPEAQYDQQHFNSAAAAPRAKSNTAYQGEMIRMQKEVGVDANNVGWYTSANLGNFINTNFIENQYYHQKELNERTVALVHDVSRSSQGALSMRAFRLSPQFMAVYKENKFTTEKYVSSCSLSNCFALIISQSSEVWLQVLRHLGRIANQVAHCTQCQHLLEPSAKVGRPGHHERSCLSRRNREQPCD